MSYSNQFFFDKKKLQDLITDFNKPHSDGELKGFVFIPGITKTGSGGYSDCIYAFPVYCKPGASSILDESTKIHQNLNVKYLGCPYPPPCPTEFHGCY